MDVSPKGKLLLKIPSLKPTFNSPPTLDIQTYLTPFGPPGGDRIRGAEKV